MATFMYPRVELVAQRNLEEMRTGGPHHVSKIIPLCLAAMSFKAIEVSHQHQKGKEVCHEG